MRLASLGLALAAAGCSGSRWARDDADYAAKYPHHTGNLARMTKQAVDARHVVGKRGLYAGFAGRDEPAGAGAEAGLFIYPRSWLEMRVGGAALFHEGEHPVSGGGNLGVRAQTPTRLAPFVGLGGYLGWAGFRSADNDFVDNDNDGLIDEFGEDEHEFVAAVAPELGVHYWLTPRLRLTGGADYRLTTDGRGNDSLFYGMSLAILNPGQRSPQKPIAPQDECDWNFALGEQANKVFEAPASAADLQPAGELPPLPLPAASGELGSE